jgi:hypothetical protein
LRAKNGQSSAAIHATELIGIELGMFVKRTWNKHEHAEKRFIDMTPEEREAKAAELLARVRARLGKTIEGEAQKVVPLEGER